MALTKISTAMISQSAAAVDLNVDAGTFYVDTTNNRVGVGGKTDPDTPLHVIGTVTATTFAGSGASLTNIPNSALTNSSITINSNAVSLGGSLTLTTANIAENTNLYYTDARADARANARITATLIDEDDMSSNSASRLPSQQSVKAYVDSEVAGLVDSAPGTLNTLNELAAALGDDASFSTTVTNSIATKLPLAGGTLTGTLTGVGVVTNGARNIIQRSNDDSSIAFANNASGTPSGHVWAAGLNYSNSNAFTIAYGSSGIPSLESHKMVITTGGNVGIGTASPESELTIEDDDATLRIRSATTTTKGLTLKYNHSGNFGQLLVDHQGNNQLDMKYYALTHKFGRNDSSQYLTITDNGNVGIGTTNPGCALDIERSSGWSEVHLNGASGGDLILQDNGVNYGEIYAGNGHGMVLKAHSGQHMYFLTNGAATPKAVITNAGNVGIGIDSPANKLQIGSVGSSGYGGNDFAIGDGTRVFSTYINSTSDAVEFYTNKKYAFLKSGSGATGNVGIGTASPDQLLHVEKTSGTTLVKTEVAANSTVGFEIAKTGSTTQSWRIVDGQTVNGKLEIYDVTDSRSVMTFDGSGNVGIGTISPSEKLHVDGIIASQNSTQGTGLLQLQGYGNSGFINHTGSSSLFFRMGSSFVTRMTLTSGGNLGVGESNPTSRIHTDGTILVDKDHAGIVFTPTGEGSSTNSDYMSALLRAEQAGYHVTTNNGGFSSTAESLNLMNHGDLILATAPKTGGSTNYPSGRVIIDTSGNVGIGTNSPGAVRLYATTPSNGNLAGQFVNSHATGSYGVKIQAGSDSSNYGFVVTNKDNANPTQFYVRGDGNIGIGTNSPSEKLHVEGSVLIDAFNMGDEEGIFFREGFSSTNKYNVSIMAKDHNGASADGLSINGYDGISFCTGSNNRNEVMRIVGGGGSDVGNVGIGTTSPTVGLQVGNSVSGETKTVIFNSEGGTENGLTVKARTNRAKLAISDNDTTGYVIAENSVLSLGFADTGANANLNIKSGPLVGIGENDPQFKLQLGVDNQSLGAITTNKQILLNIDGGFSSTNSKQYKVAGFVGTTSGGTDDIFGSTYTSGEQLKNFYLGLVSDFGYFNSARFSVVQGGAERFTVTQGGNVGIGDSTPSAALHIYRGSGDSNVILETPSQTMRIDQNSIRTTTASHISIFANNQSNQLYLSGSSSRVGINTSSLSADGLIIGTAPNGNCELDLSNTSTNGNRWRLNSSQSGYLELRNVSDGLTPVTFLANGNVGINEGAAEGLLHIRKGNFGGTYTPDSADQLILENSDSVAIDLRTPNGNSGVILFSDSDGRGRGILQYAHSNDTMYFNTASATRMTLSHTGFTVKLASGSGNADLRYNTGNDVVSYDTSSARFKINIRDNTEYGLASVNALQSRMFEYKDDDRTDVGLIAEEVVEVIPELVGLDDDGTPLTVDYKRFVSVLVKAIQEQQDLIESLNERIEALEESN